MISTVALGARSFSDGNERYTIAAYPRGVRCAGIHLIVVEDSKIQ